jgi:hypothetical protein
LESKLPSSDVPFLFIIISSQQVIFDAPYNLEASWVPRVCSWRNWKKIIIPMLGRLTPAKLQELSRHTSVDEELAEMIEENQKKFNTQFVHSCDDDEDDEGEFAMDEHQEKLRQIRKRSISSADGSFYLEQNKENVDIEVVDTTNAAVQTSGKTLEEAEKTAFPQKSVSTKERLKSFLPAFLQKNKEQVN